MSMYKGWDSTVQKALVSPQAHSLSPLRLLSLKQEITPVQNTVTATPKQTLNKRCLTSLHI